MSEPLISAYVLLGLPGDRMEAECFTIKIERRDFVDDVWAVLWMGQCLSRSGKWDYEPLPSARTDYWKREHRFPLEEALRRAQAALPALTCGGLTAADVLAASPTEDADD